jgi:hypothetical protein
MHEERKGTNSVLDNASYEVLGQQSQIKIRNQEEITQFVEEKMKIQLTDQVDETDRRRIEKEQLINWFRW